MSYTTIHKTAREHTVDAGLAIKYLRRLEWEMGNGQCPECEACNPNDRQWQSQCDHLGHFKRCKLAKALEALGEHVEWRRVNRSPALKRRMEYWRKMLEPSMRAAEKAILTYRGFTFAQLDPVESGPSAAGAPANPAPSQAQGTASPSTRPGKAPGRGSSKRGSTRTR